MSVRAKGEDKERQRGGGLEDRKRQEPPGP